MPTNHQIGIYTLFSFFKFVSETAAGFAILAYFAGWLYLYYYLRFFGFNIFEVEIPFHYFFVYAFPVLVAPLLDSSTLLLLLLSTIIVIVFRMIALRCGENFFSKPKAYSALFFSKNSALVTVLKPLALCTITLTAFAGITVLAKNSATSDASQVASSPSVYITLSSAYADQFRSDFEGKPKFKIHDYFQQEGKYDLTTKPVKVVMVDKNRYYLFLVKDVSLNSGLALSLPKKEVITLGFQRG